MVSPCIRIAEAFEMNKRPKEKHSSPGEWQHTGQLLCFPCYFRTTDVSHQCC